VLNYGVCKLAETEICDTPCDFVLDVEFYHEQIDLIIKMIKEDRTEAALHMLEQSKKKFETIKTPTQALIIPL